MSQSVKDSLCDAETLRLNATTICLSNKRRAIAHAGLLGEMVRGEDRPDVAAAAALYAAHAAFRACPALRCCESSRGEGR